MVTQLSDFHTAPQLGSSRNIAEGFLTRNRGQLQLPAWLELTAKQEAAESTGPLRVVPFDLKTEGLPIFGTRATVGVDARGSVVAFNSDPVPAEKSSRAFNLDESAARSVGGKDAEVFRVEKGYLPTPAALVPAWRVTLLASGARPPRAVYLDAADGGVLMQTVLRRNATAQVFAISPTEKANGVAGTCPPMSTGDGGTVVSICAQPVTKTLNGLTSATNLSGHFTTAYNCAGRNVDTEIAADMSTPCTQTATASGGVFNSTPDFTGSLTDPFAELSAYNNVQTYLETLQGYDSAVVTKVVPVPAFVNLQDQNAPFDNAFFTETPTPHISFGQGDFQTDFAYDATVVYHEMTHAVVNVTAKFNEVFDALGYNDIPGALNEATADSFSNAIVDKSAIGTYDSRSVGLVSIRDASKLALCEGHAVSNSGAVLDGLDGEVHDDSLTWSGLAWELHAAMAPWQSGSPSCGPGCDPGLMIQIKTLELSTAQQAYASYGQNLKTAASSLFPNEPAVPQYIGCLVDRYQLASCDKREVTLYSNERTVNVLTGDNGTINMGSIQNKVVTTGAATVTLCGATPNVQVMVRAGSPVAVAGNTFTADQTLAVSTNCSTPTTVPLQAAGTYYFMGKSPTGADSAFRIITGSTGIAARPAFVEKTCVFTPTTGTMTAPPGGSNGEAGGNSTSGAGDGSGSGNTTGAGGTGASQSPGGGVVVGKAGCSAASEGTDPFLFDAALLAWMLAAGNKKRKEQR